MTAAQPVNGKRHRAGRGVRRSTPTEPWSDLMGAFSAIGSKRNWTVEGVIEGTPIVTYVAPEKSCKSWHLIQLCVAAVVGQSWLGRFRVKRQGPAVYLDGEMGEMEFARRAARLARGYGRDPSEVLTHLRHCWTASVRLHEDDSDLLAVVEAVHELQPVVVVLDPWRNHLDGNENDSDVTLAAMYCVEALRQAASAPVIIAHHLNKAGAAAGSRAFKTRADLVITAEDVDDEPRFTAVGRTLRSGDPIGGGARWSVQVHHQHDDDDTRATTISTRFEGEVRGKEALSTAARRVLEVLRGQADAVTVSAIRRRLRMNHGTAMAALRDLHAAGLAERVNKRWRVSTDLVLGDIVQPASTASKELGQ